MENHNQPEVTNQLDNFFNISFDGNAKVQLKQIALWAKICSLCTFIGYGIALVVALFGHKDFALQTEGPSISTYLRSGSSIGGVLVSILIGGAINYFLYRFAVATGQAVESMDPLKFNEGFNSLRIYFKIFGIILIVVLSIVALFMLIAIIGLGMSGGR